MWTKRKKMRGGFTLVEILTTMAIIGILLSVLLPALNQVGKSAANVKQKAQFHAIEMALETFRADTGDYPPSNYYQANATTAYCGSQRLAEAIVGRDGLGFHPDSVFSPYGTDSLMPGGNELYYPGINGLTQAQKEANLSARKGPYLELESANAVLLSAIYTDAVRVPLVDSFVLADSFRTVKHRTTGKKIGMPILYYKANRFGTRHLYDATYTVANTYDVRDSIDEALDTRKIAAKPNRTTHPMNWMNPGPIIFYQRTQNPNFTTVGAERPYRAESFILQSAGADGLYGTSDDVFNFDEGK
jgi:prepilin-type N-terminal cleavage/methylation domain-containing protein